MTTLRRPLAVVSAILVMVVFAGVGADRLSPGSARRPKRLAAVTRGGVWVCPIVSIGKPGGFLSIANGSVQRSTVQVQFVRPSKSPLSYGVKLAPGTAATLKAPIGDASGAIVRWAGGDVVASRSAATPALGGQQVAAGATCSRTGERLVGMPGLRTAGADAHVVLMNPSSADAVVDVSFVGDGDEVAPESLTNRVVPALGRLDVRAGDFMFDKPEFAALVRVKTGAIAADALLISSRGAAIITAGPPVRDGLAVGVSSFGARLDYATVGEDPSTLIASTFLPGGRRTSQGFPPSVDPLSATAVAFSERGPIAVSLSAREGSPFLATLGWAVAPRGAGDVAISPLVEPAGRWLAVTQPVIGSASATMVLANPGVTPVRVRTRLLTPAGQVASGQIAEVVVQAGRVAAFPLGAFGGATGVDVVALDGKVALAIVVAGGAGDLRFLYAVSGARAVEQVPIAVVVNPQTGVAAKV